MKNFTYTSECSRFENCHFCVARYANNQNLAIAIFDNEGPVTYCTVNTPVKLTDDRIAVKNYSENTGMDNFLIDMGIIEKEPIDHIESGWVEIPVHKLTQSGLDLIKEQTE